MKPIIFSTEMVKAILDGRKTMTRRVVKPQPKYGVSPCAYVPTGWAEKGEPNEFGVQGCRCSSAPVRCPYDVGDILWVRETWGISNFNEEDYSVIVVYKADDNEVGREIILPEGKFTKLYDSMSASCSDWRSSIHMPREAASIFLKVTDVRVERLKDITEEDAVREGVISGQGQKRWTARSAFMDLWDVINFKRGYPWESNPYVWVIEFERTEV